MLQLNRGWQVQPLILQTYAGMQAPVHPRIHAPHARTTARTHRHAHTHALSHCQSSCRPPVSVFLCSCVEAANAVPTLWLRRQYAVNPLSVRHQSALPTTNDLLLWATIIYSASLWTRLSTLWHNTSHPMATSTRLRVSQSTVFYVLYLLFNVHG